MPRPMWMQGITQRITLLCEVYQHLEDKLTKAGADTDDILALTTAREGATNLRNYFTIAGKKANAETAVKVAGATAKHCIATWIMTRSASHEQMWHTAEPPTSPS